MKHRTKTLILALIAFAPSIVQGQITLEHQYPNANVLFTITLADGSIKYMDEAYNNPAYNVTLYNLDHSVFKTLQLDVSDYCSNGPDSYLESARYITDKLFDSDDDIEVFTVANCWDASSQTTTQRALVLDENGNILFVRENAAGNSNGSGALEGIGYSSIVNTPNGTKMILNTAGNGLEVYSLPGTFPAQMEIVSGGGPEMKAYPNPVQGTFSLTYDTHGITFGTVAIWDIQGHQVLSQPFTNSTDSLQVDISSLAAGTYTLSLIAEGKTLGSKKIVVAK